MRELNVNEIEQVNGGNRFAAGAVVAGIIYDAVKAGLKAAAKTLEGQDHNSSNPNAATNRL